MTELERQVLAHVVVDPDAWYAHAVEVFGEERGSVMLAAKVERWYQDYIQASAMPDYKTRAERDAAMGIAN